MSDKKDGGPAFPTETYDHNAAVNGLGVTVTDRPGMSLRDWFASRVPFEIVTAAWSGKPPAELESLCNDAARAAFMAVAGLVAYEWADAMLAARAQEDGDE